MRLFTLLMFCVMLVCVAGFNVRARQQGQQAQDEEISIKLRGVDGKIYDISEMRGNVLLVSFGATWCIPCKDELAALAELQKEYRGKPVKFLWVNIEREDELSDKELLKYAKKQRLAFPVLRDPTKFTYAQFSQRVRIPLIIFFNKAGNVALPAQFGMSTPEMYKTRVRERLDKLLATQTANSSAGTK